MNNTRQKIINWILLLLAIFFTQNVWAARDSWASEPKTGCKICFVVDRSTGCELGWESTIDDVNLVGAEWTGPVVDGKADGQGNVKLILRNGDGQQWEITGNAEMKAGKLDGNVNLKWSGYIFDEVSYEGSYKEGRREGTGTYSWSLGRMLQGNWKDDKMDGKGIYKCNDGEMYEGDWKNGLKDGKGVMKYIDGRVYEGDWKDGVKEGKGTFHWPQTHGYHGNTYVGDWKNNNMEGQGIMYYPDESVMYQGDWKNSKLNGKGIYHWDNGETYTGEFAMNQREGIGVMKYANGDVYEGDWQADQRNGNGELKDVNGRTIFKGQWKDDQPAVRE